MKDNRSEGEAPDWAVAFSRKLQLRLGPVADARTGTPTGVDLRLYRRLEDSSRLPAALADTYLSTQAGFRVPLEALRPLGRALLIAADALGAE